MPEWTHHKCEKLPQGFVFDGKSFIDAPSEPNLGWHVPVTNFLSDMSGSFYNFRVACLNSFEIFYFFILICIFPVADTGCMNRPHAEFPRKIVLKSDECHWKKWKHCYIGRWMVGEILIFHSWQRKHHFTEQKINGDQNQRVPHIFSYLSPWWGYILELIHFIHELKVFFIL